MRAIVAALLLFVIVLTMADAGVAQTNFWEPTGGPASAHIAALVVTSDGTVLAGTSHGILRSSDNGESWDAVGLENVGVSALVVASNGIVFAGTDSAGLLRSSNTGLSWEPVDSSLTARSIASLSSNTHGEIVASENADNPRIFYSTDAGDHWTLMTTFPSQCKVAVNDAGYLFIGSRYGPTNICRTTDHGGSWLWMPAPDLSRVTDLALNPRGELFVATMEGIFRTTDNGGSWDSASGGLTNLHIADLALAAGDTIFAGTFSYDAARSDVFRSTDNGNTWTSTALATGATALATHTGGIVYAGGVCLSRSSDNGDHWSRLSLEGWCDLSIGSLALNSGDTLYASGSEGLFRSTDLGAHWQTVGTGYSELQFPVCMAMNADGGLFLCVVQDLGGWTLRSTDGGLHWTILPFGYWLRPFGFLANGHIFATRVGFGGSDVCRSTNNGDSWESVSASLGESLRFSQVITLNDNVFLGTSDGVYRSTNEGADWAPINNGLTERIVDFLVKSPRGDLFVVTSNFENTSVFHSTNGGETWTFQYSLPAWVRALVADAAGNLYVSVSSLGVFRNGVLIKSGLDETVVSSLALDSQGYLFAGTADHSVYRSIEPTTAVHEVADPLPLAFTLEQNYPNPFNPSTTIKYTVAGTKGQASGVSEVRMVIYDVLGREVATLVNARQAPGTYTVEWNAAGYASGVYFCRLTAGSYSATKAILLER